MWKCWWMWLYLLHLLRACFCWSLGNPVEISLWSLSTVFAFAYLSTGQFILILLSLLTKLLTVQGLECCDIFRTTHVSFLCWDKFQVPGNYWSLPGNSLGSNTNFFLTVVSMCQSIEMSSDMYINMYINRLIYRLIHTFKSIHFCLAVEAAGVIKLAPDSCYTFMYICLHVLSSPWK